MLTNQKSFKSHYFMIFGHLKSILLRLLDKEVYIFLNYQFGFKRDKFLLKENSYSNEFLF
ncbi:hypothetical protein C6370_04815 [Bacillus atrophaeus]|nr:hypothetical protein C6370_04815 [Bacillus atrophaeus]